MAENDVRARARELFGDKRLGFGFLRLPLTDPQDQSSVDIDEVSRMVDRFLESGFTYFDTAFPYHNGLAENALRRALVERHPRESYVIADKMPMYCMPKGKSLQEVFDMQLENLGVDCIDYYLLHNLYGSVYELAEELGAFEFVQRMKEGGRVKHIGFSIHDTAERVDEILTKHPEMEFVQLQINYIDWENEAIQARKCYEAAMRHGKPVVVMEPVKGGTLATLPEEAEAALRAVDPGASPASWALRYVGSLDGVGMVLSGMSTMEQIEDNTAVMGDFRPLDEREQKAVQEAGEIVVGAITVPCTACEYCTKGCPKHIPIPTYFALYNADLQDNKANNASRFRPQHDYYDALVSRLPRASECIQCGKCEKVCPQHIPIRSFLKDVARNFEG